MGIRRRTERGNYISCLLAMGGWVAFPSLFGSFSVKGKTVDCLWAILGYGGRGAGVVYCFNTPPSLRERSMEGTTIVSSHNSRRWGLSRKGWYREDDGIRTQVGKWCPTFRPCYSPFRTWRPTARRSGSKASFRTTDFKGLNDLKNLLIIWYSPPRFYK